MNAIQNFSDINKAELAQKYASLKGSNNRLRQHLAAQPWKQAMVNTALVNGGAAAGAIVDHYLPDIGGQAPSKVIGGASMLLGWLVLDMPEMVVAGAGMVAPHVRDFVAEQLVKA